MKTGNSALVARRYELSGSLVALWVREFKSGKYSTGSNNELNFKDLTRENLQLYQEIYQENDQLKKMLGDKELEIAVLKNLIKKKNSHLLTKLK